MKIIDKDSLIKSQRYWLNDAKNLVTTLSKFYGDIKLDVVSQKFTKLIALEADLLKTNEALVRKITLSNTDKTFVFARTIVPKNTYDYFTQDIDNLGTKPIGDNLLFDKSKFDRDEFIIRKLSANDFLQETAKEIETEIFSRSSLFEYKDNRKLKFLITEYFLILPEKHDA
ncbi:MULTISPECIES: chorismate--pyruvate lyase family protein [unclassified Francisella]|uniref:chorismate--pyruvate lyase family protein n=1 Tax=unclassified Francisella TaxID=2610885 RepID=UPI002E34B8B4|nr:MULTISPECIES: chorismate lyase [unclassified Francisella]MED7818719.1 chorismate lyase [Francisella sp. 19S2-4]MED7829564.1 chorismate lyase [Francisella sp. 19S2-10]